MATRSRIGVLGLLCLAFVAAPGYAANTHSAPSTLEEMQAIMGDMLTPFVVSGCLPTVPSSSLTLAAIACKGYVNATTPGSPLVYITQASHTVGPFAEGDGTYWLAIHKSPSAVVGGWTRQAGTHYLWQLGATQPASPEGAMVVGRIVVAANVITTVGDFRRPRSLAQRGVFDVTDPLYGATGLIDSPASAAIQAAEDARSVQNEGGTLYFRAGSYYINAPIIIRSGGTITGEGMAKTMLYSSVVTDSLFQTTGTSGTTARITFQEMTLSAFEVKTGGAAILADTPVEADIPQSQLVINHISCQHHFVCFYIRGSAYAHVTDNMLENVRNIGILVETLGHSDAGDNVISNNVMSAAAGSVGIETRTGGNRIIGNKILGFPYGINVNPTSTTVPLSDTLIANNSIENMSEYGVLVQTVTNGNKVVNLQINNNQFAVLLNTNPLASNIGISGDVVHTTINSNLILISAINQFGISIGPNVRSETPNGWTITGNVIHSVTITGTFAINIPEETTQRGIVTGNYITGIQTAYIGESAQYTGMSVLFANLAFFGGPGSSMYCLDCQVTSGADNSCAGGGTGAMAFRIVTSWRCFATQN